MIFLRLYLMTIVYFEIKTVRKYFRIHCKSSEPQGIAHLIVLYCLLVLFFLEGRGDEKIEIVGLFLLRSAALI